jgi:hypothetical protein
VASPNAHALAAKLFLAGTAEKHHTLLDILLCLIASALVVPALTIKRAEGYGSDQGTDLKLDGDESVNIAYSRCLLTLLSFRTETSLSLAPALTGLRLSHHTGIATMLQSVKAGGVTVLRTRGFNGKRLTALCVLVASDAMDNSVADRDYQTSPIRYFRPVPAH